MYLCFLACSLIRNCHYLSNISNSSTVVAVSEGPYFNIFLEKCYSLRNNWIHMHQSLGEPSLYSHTGIPFKWNMKQLPQISHFLVNNCSIFQLNVKCLVSLLVLKSGMAAMKCTVWRCGTKLQTHVDHTIAIAAAVTKSCGCLP